MGNSHDFRINADTTPIADKATTTTIEIENIHLMPGIAKARSEIAVQIQMTAPWRAWKLTKSSSAQK